MHEGRIPVASRLLQPINVFISYAEQDEERLQELIKYLSPLEKEKLITLWHRGKKMPQKKNQRARSATPWEEAQIILLLITGKYVSEINGEGERILLEVGEKTY